MVNIPLSQLERDARFAAVLSKISDQSSWARDLMNSFNGENFALHCYAELFVVKISQTHVIRKEYNIYWTENYRYWSMCANFNSV